MGRRGERGRTCTRGIQRLPRGAAVEAIGARALRSELRGSVGVHACRSHARIRVALRVGRLVCVASKNENASDVKAVWEQRGGEMALSADQIALWEVGCRSQVYATEGIGLVERMRADAQVNWGRKAASVRRISATLGLPIESFVFLDDNPAEVNRRDLAEIEPSR